MAWTVVYHPEVVEDLESLGPSRAKVALKVIEERIRNGEPDKAGSPLRDQLAGYRRIRTQDIRIVYHVNGKKIEVLIIAVGARRDSEVYENVSKRRR